jgi:hypothetical protein
MFGSTIPDIVFLISMFGTAKTMFGFYFSIIVFAIGKYVVEITIYGAGKTKFGI